MLGVPAGTLLGQALGWRATFWAVSIIGLLAAAALLAWVPAVPADPGANLLREFRALKRTQVLLAMLISTLSSVSLFSVFTYITPLLETQAGISAHGVSIALLLFGVGLTLGNLLGGRLADWRLMPAVMVLFAALVPVLLLFREASGAAIPAVAVMMVWGALAFALVSPLQMRVVEEATEAPNLASTLNQGAFNLGNATGAWAGGLVVAAGFGYRALPLLGAATVVVALGFTILSYVLERHATPARA